MGYGICSMIWYGMEYGIWSIWEISKIVRLTVPLHIVPESSGNIGESL